jgi:hypothetical protein
LSVGSTASSRGEASDASDPESSDSGTNGTSKSLRSVLSERCSTRRKGKQIKVEDEEQMADAITAMTNISSNSFVLSEQMKRANDLEEQEIKLSNKK